MTDFWFPALALGGLAAAFVLFPLVRSRSEGRAAALRRASNLAIFEDRLAEIRADRASGAIAPDEADALEAELKRSLLRDADPEAEASATDTDPGGRGLLVAGAVAVPLLAIVLYADWGLSLGALSDLALAEDVRELDSAESGGEAGAGQMRDMAIRLAARLEAEPEDLDGWFLLGRTRLNLGEFDAAAEAFGEVARRAPAAVAPRVFQAQALYMADERTLTPRVRAVIDATLTLAPGQPIMLELLAMDAFQNRRYEEAADLFGRVLASDIEDAARRRFLQDGFARARELAGLPPTAPPEAVAGPVPAAVPARGPALAAAPEVVDGPSVRVEISVAPETLADAPPGAALFVLARPTDGSRMPLAVQRLAPAARAAVTLTTADAMSPAASLASVDEAEVLVRLSMSGTAGQGPDDIEARFGPVSPDEAPLLRFELAAVGSEARLVSAAPGSAAEEASASAPASGTDTESAAPVSVSVLVELSEGMAPPPDADVFVFAREIGGPPMPLAVTRLKAEALPTLVRLDASMAMMPGRSLGDAERVEIVARVTRSGGVAAQAGDLEGRSAELDPAASSRVIPLLIDRILD